MKVVTICGGKRTDWNSRKKAMDFFLEGAMCCDGSESDRYFTIYAQLHNGAVIATDDL